MSCDLVSKNLNVEEEQDLGENDSSVNIFVFPAPKQEKLVRQLLLMVFSVNISKNYIPLDIHRKSGELILRSKKNMGFKVLVIGFSHSKLS